MTIWFVIIIIIFMINIFIFLLTNINRYDIIHVKKFIQMGEENGEQKIIGN